MPGGLSIGALVALGLLAIFFLNWVKVLNEYERGVVFRLGNLVPRPKGPGLVFVFAPIDRMVKVNLRLVALDVPPQDIITKDNVSVKVNAVVFFRVVEPIKAIVEVENFLYATSQLAQTTLRSILGQAELDDLLAERDRLNMQLQDILDKHTDPWGIKVTSVEVKHVDLPGEMQRAIAKQAEAEREKRAKVIHAEGEFLASEMLSKAAMLDELGEAGREVLAEFLEKRSYADGFLLFQQKQEASELLVVSQGSVGLRKGGEVIASLGVGECLGGVSLVAIGTRECEAFADGEVEVLALTRESYLRLRADYPGVALDLFEGILRHLSSALRDILGALGR